MKTESRKKANGKMAMKEENVMFAAAKAAGAEPHIKDEVEMCRTGFVPYKTWFKERHAKKQAKKFGWGEW